MNRSTTAALSRTTFADILSYMKFAPLELQLQGRMRLHGVHFAALVGIPLLVTLGLLAYSKRYFRMRHERGPRGPEGGKKAASHGTA